MGGDGGTLSHARRDQLRMFTPKGGPAAAADPAAAPATAAAVALSTCALSREALEPPIVVCSKGYLYNKAAVLTHLLSLKRPAGSGPVPAALAAAVPAPAGGGPNGAFSHLRRRSDVMDVKPRMLPPARRRREAAATAGREGVVVPAFVCPITQREATGRERWLAIVPCGCVVSAAGWDAVRAAAVGGRCPVCESPMDGRVVLGGGGGAGGRLGKRPAKGGGGAGAKKRERRGDRSAGGGDAEGGGNREGGDGVGERGNSGGGGGMGEGGAQPPATSGKGAGAKVQRSGANAKEPDQEGEGAADVRPARSDTGKRQRRE